MNKFKKIETFIKDLIEPKIFYDNRGYFLNDFFKLGIKYDFVQDNQSISKKIFFKRITF